MTAKGTMTRMRLLSNKQGLVVFLIGTVLVVSVEFGITHHQEQQLHEDARIRGIETNRISELGRYESMGIITGDQIAELQLLREREAARRVEKLGK